MSAILLTVWTITFITNMIILIVLYYRGEL